MPRFTVRVQLQGAALDEYAPLREAMQKDGFTKTIFSKKKQTTYRLPQAEYAYEDKSITASDVLKKVKQIVTSTGRDYAILVTESKTRAWYGLAVAEDETDE
jgi:hypothetical protein